MNARAHSFLVGLALATGLAAGGAEARCLRYAPTQVTLTGKLTQRTVPGPPNYLSVAQGDFPEMIIVLVLDEPICVTGNSSSTPSSQSHSKVEEVQLVVEGSAHLSLIDKGVRATGTLSSAQTGHHRTPVLLTVKGLRAS
ncbi:MAG: DUF4431 domain-containing protein [Myxococcota bacterium]